MPLLPIVGLITLITTLLFSATLLGLNAHLTYLTSTYLGGYFQFAALSIASASLTLLSVPLMLIIERTGKGVFTSTVIFELVWLAILWVLWLASAVRATEANSIIFPDGCDFGFGIVDTTCREFTAVVAFIYLTWFALFAYTVTLFVFAIRARAKSGGAPEGNVWTCSVGDLRIGTGATKSFGKSIVWSTGRRNE